MDRRRTLGIVFWVAGLAACGGRDPLLEVDPSLVPPLPVPPDGGTARRDTAPLSPVLRDAGRGPATPPGTVADAGATPRLDAGAITPPPPMANCDFPRCIRDLQAACLPAGTCTQQRSGGSNPSICYANGVKFLSSPGAGRNNFMLRVLAPGNTPCYTIQSESRGAGVVGINYFNPRGQMVASGFIERGTLYITCSDQMVPQPVALSCQPGVMGGGTMCTAGSCM
jgi:hypothetical protein